MIAFKSEHIKWQETLSHTLHFRLFLSDNLTFLTLYFIYTSLHKFSIYMKPDQKDAQRADLHISKKQTALSKKIILS